MKLTIIQPSDVPEPLRRRYGPYDAMFHRLFDGHGLSFETVRLTEGDAMPDPAALDAILITGSPAGVYDNHIGWMEPLRVFIRRAYETRTPMVGICFGHQIMAHALGGDVRKSDKGWGLGRHTYRVVGNFPVATPLLSEISIACSHQDQVIVPPPEAETVLASDFTPHAGLVYRNGAAMSLQPHPEFTDDYAAALVHLRRGKAPDEAIDSALGSFATPSHSPLAGDILARFLKGARTKG